MMNQIRCFGTDYVRMVNHSVIYVTVKEKANDENSCFVEENDRGSMI
jgi:hypothetical protein